MVTTPWFGQRGEFEGEPFAYDPPKELRGKLAHYFKNTMDEAIDDISGLDEADAVRHIGKLLTEALGVPRLPPVRHFRYQFQDFIYNADEKACIRAIEVLLNLFTGLYFSGNLLRGDDWRERLRRMVRDVNALFRNYTCGYQAEIGTTEGEPFIRMLRADSEFLHVETVRRPLSLLRGEEFQEAAQQFEDALKEHTGENYADAITDANSAFETVMKVILQRESGKASQLIRELTKRGYLPPYLETGALQLTDLLEMLPRLRDAKSDAHGRLHIKTDQLPNYSRLAISLAGSLMAFLVEEHKRRAPTESQPPPTADSS